MSDKSVSIDSRQAREYIDKLKISVVPTLLVVSDDKILQRILGKDAIKHWLLLTTYQVDNVNGETPAPQAFVPPQAPFAPPQAPQTFAPPQALQAYAPQAPQVPQGAPQPSVGATPVGQFAPSQDDLLPEPWPQEDPSGMGIPEQVPQAVGDREGKRQTTRGLAEQLKREREQGLESIFPGSSK